MLQIICSKTASKMHFLKIIRRAGIRADNGSMGHGSMGRMGHQNWMGQMGHGSLLSDP